MTIIQIFLLVAFCAGLVLAWKRAKQGAISRREAVAWSGLWIVAAAVVIRPEISSLLAHSVGIGRGSDLAMYLAVIVLFVMVFNLFVQHHRQQREITDLVRREALKDLERV